MNSPRIIVVGGGIYGWGVARRAAELGAAVTVVDPRGVDDADRASGGVTRLLRLEYGSQSHFSEHTLRARMMWREIEAQTGVELYRETGVLFLVPDGDDGEWENASLATTSALGHGGVRLEPGEIKRRWPSIRPGGLDWGLANTTGGFLWANRATRVMAGLAADVGAVYWADRVVSSDARGVDLASGERLTADLVVLTTGSWTRALEPSLPITPARQVTVYFRGGPRDFPVFGEGAPFAMYGLPGHDDYGLKLGSHVTGPDGDPDDPAQRIASGDDLNELRIYAARRFGLTGPDAEIVRADVCFYAMTPTEAPVIDHLPDGRFVCAGFSGHGFKFAPVLAAAAADKLLGHGTDVDLTPFGLLRNSADQGPRSQN